MWCFKILAVFYFLTKISHAQFLKFLFDQTNAILNNGSIPDTTHFQSTYDFIIIGSGSGGSVLANRLSEEKNWTILLLEAGEEESFLTDVPLTTPLNHITGYNWGYRTNKVENACNGLEDGVCYWPKGRALGGTSVLNFLIYTRGHRRDYDGWAELGNDGWSYDEILPYFKKSENINIPRLMKSPYHGKGGNIDVEESSYVSKLFSAFMAAGKEWGYDDNDPNGESQLGFSRIQATMRKGRRCSAAKGYLRPVRNRRNLFISSNARVTKIIIDPVTKTAVAVQFLKNKQQHLVYASKEIILSAGSIGSPQLLMLSGVGPKEHLEELGIPVIQDLRVGYNLQDHPTLWGLSFLVNDSISIVEKEIQRQPLVVLDYLANGRGKFTIPAGSEGIAFVRTNISRFPSDYPDIEIIMATGAITGDTSGSLRSIVGIPDKFYNAVYRESALEGKHAFTVGPILLRPKSRGKLSLKSKNPFHWPIMEPNYHENKEDLRVLVEGIKMCVALGESKSFQKFDSKLLPKPYLGCESYEFRSDAYWECCVKQLGSSINHQVGTCKMGPSSDLEAVVNPQLQVYGIKNLRVVDGSIIPEIPASHTNAVVFMIGEKAADLIKDFWRNR